jgi:membrane-associated phospholipid phosphatase
VIVGALFVPTGPLALDSRWAEAMGDIETPFLTHIALIFNAVGHGLLRALTLFAIGLVLLFARRWRALVAFAVAEALTPLVANVIKLLVDRPRPPVPMIDAHGSSYPSGHAAYACATAIALVLLFTRPGPRRLPWFGAATLVSAAMAWSRIYLQVHWLSDALAGAVLGLSVVLLSFGALQTVALSGLRRFSRADGATTTSAQGGRQQGRGRGDPAGGGPRARPERS